MHARPHEESMGRIAFVFPGQGSQSVGMGEALAERFPGAARTFTAADAALGEPISGLAFAGPAEELDRTQNAQPALLATSIAYLRALLPVPGDSICSERPALADCEKKAKAVSKEFDAELAKDDASYDERKAASLYEASHAALAECRTPEAECLTVKLDSYGGNAETRRYLADTLKSLVRRQELAIQAGAEASEACLNAGVQQYQSRIVEDYKRFAREPVLFFQAQLHRDFRVLYDAQVGCLQATIRPAKKSGNTRNAARSSSGRPPERVMP